MNWMDLLRMSSGNLKRRKLRTFLTVLGVIIGTTSIVVMISLGLGMQEEIYKEIEQSGGLNTIAVSGVSAGDSMIYYGDGDSEESTKRLTDSVVDELAKLSHVTVAYPQYDMSVILLKGPYEGWAQLTALTPEGMKARNIELSPGSKLPEAGSKLELLYGNGVITQFMEKGSQTGYWETGEVADIDLSKDSLFLILDQESYYASQDQSDSTMGMSADGSGESSSTPVKPVQKYSVLSCGVTAGDYETYTEHYYNVYCDLDTLKQVLKKEFSGRAIPGQPTTKSGKPYKDFTYSSIQVKVDNIEEVENVAATIRSMGYNTRSTICRLFC